MHPSSQNILRGGIYPFQKITRKFDFRSACKKIPKTTAFLFILTLILGIFLYKINTFSFVWNLILQSRIYLCKVEFTFSIHQQYVCEPLGIYFCFLLFYPKILLSHPFFFPFTGNRADRHELSSYIQQFFLSWVALFIKFLYSQSTS